MILKRIFSTKSSKNIKTLWPISLLAICALLFVWTYPFGNNQKINFILFPLFEYSLFSKGQEALVREISQSVGTKSIRIEYNQNDFLVNQWVFQWDKFNQDAKIWPYAYSPPDNADDVCEIASAWKGGITLLSSSQTVIANTLSLCRPLISEVISK